MKRISAILKKDQIQRRCAIVLFILWTIMMVNERIREAFSTVWHINAIVLYVVPAVLLLLQFFFNRQITWFLSFTIIFAHILKSVYDITYYIIIDSKRDFLNAIKWDFQTIAELLFILFSYTLICWFYYKIKPVKIPLK